MRYTLLLFVSLALPWFCSPGLHAQSGTDAPVTISGTVTDPGGEPLIGVTVMVAGTSGGTVTDLEGNYSISVVPGRVLRFSYTGYETREIEAGNQTRLDVTMSDSATDLAEVVVIGYGTQRREDLTGAVSSAPVEAFREAPNASIVQSLNGTIPGLSVGQATAAGSDPGLQIRGANTINGNRDVLLVVDGIIYRGSLSDLNPNDVESVDVLKDASSKAIYGAQGANGVVIVTTKRGRTSRKPTITYSGSYATQNPTQDRRLQSREEYLNTALAVDYQNAFLGPDFTQPNPDFNLETDVPFFGPILEGLQEDVNFDWLDATRQNGYLTDHQLSIAGGGDRSNYFISGGYTDQQGIVLNDSYQRITARVNLDIDVTDWLTLGTQSSGTFADYSGDSPNLGLADNFSPLARPRNADGSFVINPLGDNVVNPLLASTSDDRDLRNRLLGIFFANVEVPFVPGLSYRVNFSNNFSFTDRQNSNVFEGGLNGRAFKSSSNTYDWLLDNILTYRVPLPGEDHNLKFTGLIGRNRIRSEGTTAEGIGYSNLTLSYNGLEQAAQQFIRSGGYEESYSYQMGRLEYEFLDRYLLTGTVRRDGFSGFAANNRTAIFPSASVGWVISEESFLAGSETLTFLKFRAGYGQSGNLTGRYSSLARIQAGEDNRYVFGDGAQTINGQSVVSLPNPNLTWERNEGINLGLDFGLFDGDLSGSLNYYRDNTRDLLFNLVLPTVTGFNSITSNVGEVANAGLELQLDAVPLDRGRFRWDIGFNIARNRNEIVSLLGFDNDEDGREDDLVASGLFIGESIQTIFNYDVIGVYQIGDDDIPEGNVPGSYRIRDVDGDGVITPEDRTILGRQEPNYSFGIRNTLTYGDFTLRIFINSVQGGNGFYTGFNEPLGVLTPGIAQNLNSYADIDFWTPLNPWGRYRLPGTDVPFDGNRFASRSFIRLQDVSLSYNLPVGLLNRLNMQQLKVFVAGKNLVTLTDWEGWDPETGQGLNDARPLLGGYSVGLTVSF